MSRMLASVGLAVSLLVSPASATRSPVKANPPHVTFGAVDVGETSHARKIKWTNKSDKRVHIFNWVLNTGVNFDYVNFEGSSCAGLDAFDPGQSCSFQIVFHPSRQGRIRGLVEFSYYTTDPMAPRFVLVPLHGLGK